LHLLSKEEEVALALRWQQQQDIDARNRLVTSHLPLVRKIAKRFRVSFAMRDDLVSEGNVALITATDHFDCTKSRLSTFAYRGIRGAMLDFLYNSKSIVSRPETSETRKAFYYLGPCLDRIEKESPGLPPSACFEIAAQKTNLPLETIVSLYGMRFRGDPSTEALGEGLSKLTGPDPNPSPFDKLGEKQQQAQDNALIAAASELLTLKEAVVFRDVCLDPTGPKDFAAIQRKLNGVSPQRIDQLLVSALEKVGADLTGHPVSASCVRARMKQMDGIKLGKPPSWIKDVAYPA
jgi:RNA polymerase sigma-32 factor